jgi:hypothetical protein
MYDILEVLFFHQPSADKRAALDRLQEALNGDFEVEGHEFVTETPLDDSRQVVRIIAASDEFDSGQEFEECVRELASEDEFPWQRIGAVPVGGTDTVLC